MAKVKHVHKLKKHKYKSGMAVFFCMLPDCHFKIEAPLSLGKESLCNICEQPFIMNEYTLRLVRPHCNNCGRREVKDADGKKHYIRTVGTDVLSHIADEQTESLKDRLSKASQANQIEDDI